MLAPRTMDEKDDAQKKLRELFPPLSPEDRAALEKELLKYKRSLVEKELARRVAEQERERQEAEPVLGEVTATRLYASRATGEPLRESLNRGVALALLEIGTQWLKGDDEG